MKYRKKLTCLALALTLIFSLTTGASAADATREQITAYLNYNLTVTYNGETQVLADANGNQVYPVTYSGTTYVPIRAIGNLLGLKVDWDQSTQTVTLTTTKADNAANISGQGGTTVFDSKGHIAKIDKNDPEGAAEIMRNAGFSEDYIKSVIGTVSNKDPLRGYETSSTGWTRLDPTHASNKTHAANDDNYSVSWHH